MHERLHKEKGTHKNPCKCLILLASPSRFERPAPSLGGKCSILLSYGDVSKKMMWYIREVDPVQLLSEKSSPDKQDKCVNEVIFCQKSAENNF